MTTFAQHLNAAIANRNAAQAVPHHVQRIIENTVQAKPNASFADKTRAVWAQTHCDESQARAWVEAAH